MRSDFISGVVEGFYGRPWTADQRKELFSKMRIMGLNTYVYAPKDDLKHRAYWRDLYTVEEAELLHSLIDAATSQNVTFVYALSPGIDITYSNSKEIAYVKGKLQQVKNLGCNAFALLFDDIESTMNDADKQVFSSFANAQVSLTNEVFEHLGQPKFMFCPTEYCESRAVPSLYRSEYLNHVGQKLISNINVMWTGPRVISRFLTVSHLKQVGKVLKRKPLIWDNLHANDYDQKRVYLGPYAGRSSTIQDYVSGVLTNPNCEFEANFVAMHTLASWSSCIADSDMKPDSNEKLEEGSLNLWSAKLAGIDSKTYHPFRALELALLDWQLDAITPRNAFGTFIGRKPPGLLQLQINTCATVTSTTSSSTDLAAGCIPASISAEGRLSSGEGRSSNSCINGVISTLEVPIDPLLTPAMRAVNSLSTEYSEEISEPMECSGVATTAAMTSVLPNAEAPVLMQVDKDGYDSGTEGDEIERTDSSNSLDIYGNRRKAPGLLSKNDLNLLVQLFYLPFEHGPFGYWLMEEFQWLKTNAKVVSACSEQIYKFLKAAEWIRRASDFERSVSKVDTVFCRLVECPNRGLVYDLFPYLWEMVGMLHLLTSFVSWLGHGYFNPVTSEDALSPLSEYSLKRRNSLEYLATESAIEEEPWIYRGGLLGDLQLLLPLETGQDLFTFRPPYPPVAQLFVARPYETTDRESVYRICRQTLYDGLDATDRFGEYLDLPGDRYVGFFLEYCPSCCFVLEDFQTKNVVGFALGIRDSSTIAEVLEKTYFPRVKEKYPFNVELKQFINDSNCLDEEESSSSLSDDQLKGTTDTLSPVQSENVAAMGSSCDITSQRANDGQRGANKMFSTSGFEGLPICSPENVLESLHSMKFSVPMSVCSRYPSLLYMKVLPIAIDSSAPKRLAVAILSALKANGSHGIYAEVKSKEQNMHDFYTRLGFFEITMIDEDMGDSIFLGRIL